MANYNSYKNSSDNRYQGENRYEQKTNINKCEPLNKKTYVEQAEKVIQRLKDNPDHKKLSKTEKLTTSKIRNILSMLNKIYNDVIMSPENKLSGDVQNQLQYMKVKLIYAAGRHKSVDVFIKESHIVEYLDDIKDDKDAFILYSRYMEALVAYHRFYGGAE